jgi:mannose-6-phosphate isomerase-like protein (cupin superfamily)
MILPSGKRYRTFSGACFFAAVLFLAPAVFVPPASASQAQDEDFGIWNTYDLEKKLNPQWKMKLGEELRFRDHNGLYYAETHLGADYKPFQYLAMGAEYQQIRASRTKNKHEKWYWDDVPRIYLTPQLPFKGFLLEDRNMLEFRIRQDARFTLRYRNLATLTAPWKWTRFQFQPYTSNEVFFVTQGNGLVEDRFFSGFKVHWWGPVYGSIYYLRHSTKNALAKWTSLNILGTSLKICF